jgi:hypothetical protein
MSGMRLSNNRGTGTYKVSKVPAGDREGDQSKTADRNQDLVSTVVVGSVYREPRTSQFTLTGSK